MTSPAAVPLMQFTATQPAFGATVRVRALAEHAGPFEDGLSLLRELNRRWGAHGELAALAGASPGQSVRLSWDTLLLLGICSTAGVALDLEHQTASRRAPFAWPGPVVQQQLAARLLATELLDAGCVAVEVTVEDLVSSEGGEA